MAAQPELNALAPTAPRRRSSAIVGFEESMQHVHIAEIAQSLGACTKLDVIVWCGGCCTKQTILNLFHKVGYLFSARPIKGFKDRAFVTYDATEISRIKIM